MKQGIFWRSSLAIAILLMATYYLIPGLAHFSSPGSPKPEVPAIVDKLFPGTRLNLGLDLMGGIQLTLGVEVDKAVETILVQMGRDVAAGANKQGMLMPSPRPLPGGALELILTVPGKKTDFEEMVAKEFPELSLGSAETLAGGNILYRTTLTSQARADIENRSIEQAVTTIRNRIDQFGVAEPDIRRQEGNRISVQLPGMESTERAINIIQQTAHLEFRVVRGPAPDDMLIPPPGKEILPMKERGAGMPGRLIVDREAQLTGDYLVDAQALPDSKNPMYYMVTMSFDRRGGEIFASLTREHQKKNPLAIVLDGKIHSAPSIEQEILGGTAMITGKFSLLEANDLAIVLRAGSLPAPVSILEERTVGPTLGQQSIDSGVMAAAVGCVIIIIFMIAIYGMSGLIADIMLLLDLGLILAGMAMFGATLTLPGIAGIVLTLGMAIDANVLVFERIREELAAGLSPAEAVELGFSHARRAIIDSNLTSIIATVILYGLGTGPIRGFAVTLTLGIIASMFTALFVSKIIFDIWVGNNDKPKNFFKGIRILPDNLDLNFVGVRKISYALSIGFIVVGLVALILRGGPSYGIDFAGGAEAQIQFAKSISDEDLKNSLEHASLQGLTVQRLNEEGTLYAIRIATVEESSTTVSETLNNVLRQNLGGAEFTILAMDMVGPKVGADLRAKALEAIYLATLFTAVYISGRFENRWFVAAFMAALLSASMWGLQLIPFFAENKAYLVFAALGVTVLACLRLRLSFALGAVVSILHDVLATVGLFFILGKSFDLTIIAALLTVVGYSLNDTIIIYDRIRENLRANKNQPLSIVINRSINQTLSRTVLTSGSTLLVTLALYFFGGAKLEDFSLAMAFGVGVGTFSSIFVASPLLLAFGDNIVSHIKDTENDTRPRDKDGRLAAQV